MGRLPPASDGDIRGDFITMRNTTLQTGAIAGLVLTLGAGSSFAGTTALPAGLALNASTSSKRGSVVRA